MSDAVKPPDYPKLLFSNPPGRIQWIVPRKRWRWLLRLLRRPLPEPYPIFQGDYAVKKGEVGYVVYEIENPL